MKKISKRTRERAALMCAVAASTGGPIDWKSDDAIIDGLDLRKVDQAAIDLACNAWLAAHHLDSLSPEREAEAESMLRTGWSPP